MNFKKKVSGSWVDVPHYVSGTGTETITTLPATIYPLTQTVTIGLKGNTVQNGTPTPDNPIMPQGTGERTGNLFDYKTAYASYLDTNGNVIATSYQINAVKNYFTNDMIGKTLTITVYIGSVGSSYVFLSAVINGTRINSDNRVNVGDTGTLLLTVTPTSTSDYWQIPYGDGRFSITASKFMVNYGSTALPYEPYDYKIPISSGGVTTNVYLGEVESTRRIKKLVLTGTGTVELYQYANTNGVRILNALPAPYRRGAGFCNIYPVQTQAGTSHCLWIGSGGGDNNLYFISVLTDLGMTTTDEFKTYLQQQYAAGTPVCVWYVLANETTGIVNEPLMKIGSYADSISGISIPTTAGANTLNVDTTVAPSEVTANYSGWHPVTSAHERENGAWT